MVLTMHMGLEFAGQAYLLRLLFMKAMESLSVLGCIGQILISVWLALPLAVPAGVFQAYDWIQVAGAGVRRVLAVE